MIGYLSGRLLAADGEELLVAAGGVGYWVTVGAHDARAVMKSAERAVELFVHTQMTVAATTGKATIHLYGFRTPEDLEAFRWVLSVPKLGARIALDLVGTLGAAELERAIHRGNAVLLQGIKGVGAQTADRLIRELRSKRGSPRSWQVFSRAPGTPLPTEQESGPVAGEGPGEPAIAVADLAAVPAPAPVPVAGADTGFEEARKILMNLQYSDQEATGALRKVAVEQGWDLPAEELVRGALAALQKR